MVVSVLFFIIVVFAYWLIYDLLRGIYKNTEKQIDLMEKQLAQNEKMLTLLENRSKI